MNAKIRILCFISCLIWNTGKGQINMVPNPDFELPSDCAVWQSQPVQPIWIFPSEYGAHWIGHGNYACLWSACRPHNGYTVPYTFMPLNGTFLNYQVPLSGKTYGSALVFGSSVFHERTYMATKLTNTLKKDKDYFVRFHVSPYYPDKGSRKWLYTGSVGMTFTQDFSINAITRFDPSLNTIPPAIEHKKLLKDTLNWIRISGKYRANGNENYVYIGNFKKDADTPVEYEDSSLIKNPSVVNFFLFEDVIVSEFDPLPNKAFLCKNKPLTFNARFYDARYEWNTGSRDSVITVDKVGKYIVTAIIDTVRLSDTVEVIDKKPELPTDILVCSQQNSLILGFDLEAQYKWSTGDTTRRIKITNSGNYTVQITTNNCQFDLSTNVKIENCRCQFYAPNAFSPNDDGINDGFKPTLNCPFTHPTDYRLTVYNRFGNLVFTTNNLNDSWNGTYLGQKCDAGVFVWQVTYLISHATNNRSETVVESGDVTIIR
jgi:gliding motility-associated-like protein